MSPLYIVVQLSFHVVIFVLFRDIFGNHVEANTSVMPNIVAHWAFDKDAHTFVGILRTPLCDLNFVPTPAKSVFSK